MALSAAMLMSPTLCDIKDCDHCHRSQHATAEETRACETASSERDLRALLCEILVPP